MDGTEKRLIFLWWFKKKKNPIAHGFFSFTCSPKSFLLVAFLKILSSPILFRFGPRGLLGLNIANKTWLDTWATSVRRAQERNHIDQKKNNNNNNKKKNKEKKKKKKKKKTTTCVQFFLSSEYWWPMVWESNYDASWKSGFYWCKKLTFLPEVYSFLLQKPFMIVT